MHILYAGAAGVFLYIKGKFTGRKLKSFLVNSRLIGAEGRFISVGQCMKRASCICGILITSSMFSYNLWS